MKQWTVYLTSKARKQLARLPEEVQGLTEDALKDLEEQGIGLRKWNVLKTNNHEYRLRLNYRYRMRYRIIEEEIIEIEVFYVGHREGAYK